MRAYPRWQSVLDNLIPGEIRTLIDANNHCKKYFSEPLKSFVVAKAKERNIVKIQDDLVNT